MHGQYSQVRNYYSIKDNMSLQELIFLCHNVNLRHLKVKFKKSFRSRKKKGEA